MKKDIDFNKLKKLNDKKQKALKKGNVVYKKESHESTDS